MTTNTKKLELDVSLSFSIEVDMTEFNQTTVKVEDLKNSEEQYIKAKIQADTVKQIIEETISRLETLGYKTFRDVASAHSLHPAFNFVRKLTDDLLSMQQEKE